MLKIRLEGCADQAQAFLYDLHQRPHIELVKNEHKVENLEPIDEVSMTLYARVLSNRRIRIVKIICKDGTEIHIPMMDLIRTEISEGVTIFTGRVFDVFG